MRAELSPGPRLHERQLPTSRVWSPTVRVGVRVWGEGRLFYECVGGVGGVEGVESGTDDGRSLCTDHEKRVCPTPRAPPQRHLAEQRLPCLVKQLVVERGGRQGRPAGALVLVPLAGSREQRGRKSHVVCAGGGGLECCRQRAGDRVGFVETVVCFFGGR